MLRSLLDGEAPDLAALQDLARRGDVKGIRQFAEELAERVPAHKTVATTLEKLARQYRVKKIRELLDSFERS